MASSRGWDARAQLSSFYTIRGDRARVHGALRGRWSLLSAPDGSERVMGWLVGHRIGMTVAKAALLASLRVVRKVTVAE